MTWAVTLSYRASMSTPDLVVLTEAEGEEEAMRDAQVLVNHGRRQLAWRPVKAQRINLPLNAKDAPKDA